MVEHRAEDPSRELLELVVQRVVVPAEAQRQPRIVAVARETNFGSRMVLGGIGMTETLCFEQGGHWMVLYESVSQR